MRLLTGAFVFLVGCASAGPIQNLPLGWRGVTDHPKPSAGVSQSLGMVPFAFAVRDTRPDPHFVGTHQDTGHIVRTSDNVAQYCSSRMGDMLIAAGARLNEAPAANVDAELLEYRVDESGTFSGLVRMRVAIRRGTTILWSGVYDGTSRRWGKDHSPENFNEALSNALAEATSKLIRDDEFGRALASTVAQPAAPAGG